MKMCQYANKSISVYYTVGTHRNDNFMLSHPINPLTLLLLPERKPPTLIGYCKWWQELAPCTLEQRGQSLVHTYIHTYIHIFIYTCIHTYIHTYIHRYIQTSTYSSTHTSTHTYIHPFTHTHIHSHIHTHIHPPPPGILHVWKGQNHDLQCGACSERLYVYYILYITFIYVYLYIFVFICVYILCFISKIYTARIA